MRAAVGLRYYLDLPVEAVAEILDVSPNTIKTQLKTALAHLRASLAEDPALVRGGATCVSSTTPPSNDSSDVS